MPLFQHKPVLVNAVLESLQPRAEGRYVDGTMGGGSHAEAILEGSIPNGWLSGFDRDAEAIAASRERLRRFEGRFALYQANYSDMAQWVDEGSCDGVLLDLGVSSHQLDTVERGFSFQQDGPLDMRMDRRQPRTAADLIEEADETELARIFWEYGDEPQSRRFARALVMERQQQRFETTGQLARCIERLAPRHGRKRHPATRVFMALRMAVNDEANSLQRGLAAACTLLKKGGRMAVISFHSYEDRLVKRFGQESVRDYVVIGPVDRPEFRQTRPPLMSWVSRKPIVAGEEECRDNPRARSAKLRVLEKL